LEASVVTDSVPSHESLPLVAEELRRRDTVVPATVMPRVNRLFDSLGPATRERLRPHVELVTLAKGRVLCEPREVPRYAFFPLDGMISLLGTTEEGHTLELATAGSDGMVGVPLALNGSVSPYQVMVQMTGAAHRVRGEAFIRECQRCEDLHATSLTYAGHVMQQIVQSAICHAFHPLIQRVCRWLLASRDCAHANTIALTQEFVAQMLGVSRPKVSQTLAALEARGLIHQGHGRIHIIDPRGLQQGSCACYRAAQSQIFVQQPLRHAR
jgi:CRP-like cAMP-binding protein